MGRPGLGRDLAERVCAQLGPRLGGDGRGAHAQPVRAVRRATTEGEGRRALMPGPRRAPPPVSSRRLTGVPRRGVVLTDPAGRCYIAALPEHGGSGVALGGDGGFHPVTPPPVTGGPTGDVIGPAGAVDEMIAVYDGVTGKLIKDGGMTIADILALIGAGGGGDVVGPASAV